MEQATGVSGPEHIIDIPRDTGSSASVSRGVDRENHEELNPADRPSTRALVPALQAPSAIGAVPSTGQTSGTRRSDNYVRRHRSPLNSGLWISIEVIVNVSQIVAAIVVLCLSRKEHPQAPLLEWVIGYTVGCFATLPHLYWRYIHRNIVNGEHEPAHAPQGSSHNNSTEATHAASASERRRNAARNAVLANPRIMHCLTTLRWPWIVSLLYGLLLEMCGYSVDVLLLLMLQTCTGYVLCSSLLVALGMPCRSSSAR